MTAPPTRLRLLHGDEADVFREHELALRRAVRRAVDGPDAVVDDACAFAWLQLLRRQPDRSTVFAWLRTVAIREAWRLSRQERRDVHLEQLPCWEKRCRETSDAATIAAHAALRAVADLPPKQRRYLTLSVAGHSHVEIAATTGATRTNVSKHLTRARASLRTSSHDGL